MITRGDGFMDRAIAYIVLFLAGVIAGATLEKYADGMCRK